MWVFAAAALGIDPPVRASFGGPGRMYSNRCACNPTGHKTD